MSIADNLARVRDRIAAASRKAGREPGDVGLIAVSKTWPPETVAEAYEAGQRVFGENKVQEIEEKVGPLPDDIDWHLIGHLQKNKMRKVLPLCGTIHTVDSLALAERMGRIAGDLGIVSRVLVQVNVADDDAKFGFPVARVGEIFGELLEVPHLEVAGLMTVPSYHDDPEQVRPSFERLRILRDRLSAEHGQDLQELSMGMSHDFEVAIEEGATLVRVGSAIFGERDYS